MSRKLANHLLGAVCLSISLLLANAAFAQDLPLPLAETGSLATTSLQLIILITLIGLAPGFLVAVTCFPFIVTVLSILRTAIGLQQAPPNILIVSLSLFLTYYVMEPIFLSAWESALSPLSRNEIDTYTALVRALEPFRLFMVSRVDADTYYHLSSLRDFETEAELTENAPLSVLIPSFILSEVSKAFQIGFLVFLPFLIIDLVVAAVLMSMGMMMVPPAIVSLPFKLAFFVVSDGWALVSHALVRGYV